MNKDDQKEVSMKAITTRAPNKRQIKPIDKDKFELFDDLDSESDEDYVADSDEESEEKECMGSSNDDEDKSEESQKEMTQDEIKEAYLKTLTSRDPSKRQIKPIDSDQLQLFENMPSESDEEYVVNTDVDSEDSDVKSSSDNGNEDSGGNESDDESEPSENVGKIKEELNIEPLEINSKLIKAKLNNVLICMMCLMDDTYSDNEIVECDSCGIMVHEDCYKINDSVFMSCDTSDASTDPWFCDSCLLGNNKPMCELCPVNGGIFKKTEDNRWVHLICALYTPGVAFNDTDNLTEVTLTEVPNKEWGGHECSLCEDPFYARIGVCISCDAGLCKNYFHVSCAQKEGLLSEPNIEENPDDPFFGQCRQHTDKDVAKRRRKHLNAAINRHKMRLEEWAESGHQNDDRIIRKLKYFNKHYHNYKQVLPEPFIPATKVRNYLEFSPVAVSLFKKKAINLDLPIDLMNSLTYSSDNRTNASSGIPAFTPDFINYYIEREKKIDDTSKEINKLETLNRDMQITEQNTSHKFNKVMIKKESMLNSLNDKLDHVSQAIHLLKKLSSDKDIISRIEVVFRKIEKVASDKPENEDKIDNDSNNAGVTNNTVNNIINLCKICNSVNDQHLLLDCDNCKKYFHIGCLDPPLTRMPKKTKQYGWECSACSPSSEDDKYKKSFENIDIYKPRQLRKSVPDDKSISKGFKRKFALLSPVSKNNKVSQNKSNPCLKKAKHEESNTNVESAKDISNSQVKEAKKKQIIKSNSKSDSSFTTNKKIKMKVASSSDNNDDFKTDISKSETKSGEVTVLSTSKSKSSVINNNTQPSTNRFTSDNIFSKFKMERENEENASKKLPDNDNKFVSEESSPRSPSLSLSQVSSPIKIKKIRIVLGSPLPKLYNLSHDNNSDHTDEIGTNKKKTKRKDDNNNYNNENKSVKKRNQSSSSTKNHNNSSGSNSNNENENENENDLANNIRKSNRCRKRRVTLLDEIEGPESKKPKKNKLKKVSSLKISKKLDFQNSSFKSSLSNGTDEPIKLKIVKQTLPFIKQEDIVQSDPVEVAYQKVIGVIAKRVPPTDPLKIATVSIPPTNNKDAYNAITSGTPDYCHKKKTIKIKLHNDDDDDNEKFLTQRVGDGEKLDELKQLKETIC